MKTLKYIIKKIYLDYFYEFHEIYPKVICPRNPAQTLYVYKGLKRRKLIFTKFID